MYNYRFSTINQLLWAAYGAANDNFMDDPNLQDLVKLQNDSQQGIQRLNQTFISFRALFPLHHPPLSLSSNSEWTVETSWT